MERADSSSSAVVERKASRSTRMVRTRSSPAAAPSAAAMPTAPAAPPKGPIVRVVRGDAVTEVEVGKK